MNQYIRVTPSTFQVVYLKAAMVLQSFSWICLNATFFTVYELYGTSRFGKFCLRFVLQSHLKEVKVLLFVFVKHCVNAGGHWHAVLLSLGIQSFLWREFVFCHFQL